MHGDDLREGSDGPAAQQTHGRGDDDEHRHHADERQDLRQNEVIGAIDTHDLHRINLFGDPHRADLRGDVRSHLTCQYQAEDGAGELEQEGLARKQTRCVGRQKGVLRIRLGLDREDRTDEDGDDQHDRQTLQTLFLQLATVLPPEHPLPVRQTEHLAHEQKVFAYVS